MAPLCSFRSLSLHLLVEAQTNQGLADSSPWCHSSGGNLRVPYGAPAGKRWLHARHALRSQARPTGKVERPDPNSGRGRPRSSIQRWLPVRCSPRLDLLARWRGLSQTQGEAARADRTCQATPRLHCEALRAARRWLAVAEAAAAASSKSFTQEVSPAGYTCTPTDRTGDVMRPAGPRPRKRYAALALCDRAALRLPAALAGAPCVGHSPR